ncbi:Ig-like domain-containing protein [Paenibacillus hexagrammi]|uniref:Ig-like domain-containing protein n=1 Tax=Paenibacillus hexagrammi TaxID=2908839 RepID=A0ABY3SKE3_9BACL|nr:Ig-like domain-containing protein [Paenibacillus sp. YPD9-1]UJF34522.1 Ig-like domain-containing protein [Paenibacillus sp. YPD9-1]
MKVTLFRSNAGKRAGSALIALLLPVTTAFPLSIYATTPAPNEILSPVASFTGWSPSSSLSVTGDSFSFDAGAYYPQLTGGQVSLTASTVSPSIADASTSGSTVSVQVKSNGTTTVGITGTDATATLTDTVEMKSILLGDTTGDGLITSADVLYINKFVSTKQDPSSLSPEKRRQMDLNGDGKIDATDSTLLMKSYVNKTPVTGGVKFLVSLSDVNDPPIATQTAITGTVQPGLTVTGTYRYLDPENDGEQGTQFQWYRGAQADGSDKTKVDGATSITYQVQADDIDKYLFFEVTPSDNRGSSGTPVIAATSSTVPDTIAPTIASTQPMDDATGVNRIADLSLTFSEPVQAAAGKSIRIYRADNSVLKTYTSNDTNEVDIQGAVVTLKNPNLDDGADFYVEIDSGAFTDLVGNPFAGVSGNTTWNFTTPDTISPVLHTTSPANQAVDAGKSADLTLTFNENVVAAAGKKITVYDKADDSVKFSYDADDVSNVTVNHSMVTIHHSDLDETASYYVGIEAGAFTDISGNPYVGITGSSSWSFTVPDTTAPTINSTQPVDDAIKIDLDAPITVTFDEAIQAVAGKTIKLMKASDDSVLESYDVNDTSKVTINGSSVSLVNPGLSGETSYYLKIDADAFKDMAGNSFAGITDKTAWSFTTKDVAPPILNNASPTNNALDGDMAANLTLTFNESVAAASGKKVTIYNKADDSMVASYDADDTSKVTLNGSTVTIMNSGLEEKSAYYVIVDAGAFTDLSGNPYAGLSAKTDWTFTVADKTAPMIASRLPVDDATGVNRTDDLKITFNEPIQAVSGKSINIYRSADHSILKSYTATDTSQVEINGLEVTLKSPNLDDGASFYVLIDQGAFKDMADNAFAGVSDSSTWNFSTPDTVAPTVVSTLPANLATGVNRTADLSLTFTEPVLPVDGKKVTIRNTVDDSVYAEYTFGTDFEVSVSDNVLTIQHGEFDGLHQYYVEIEAGALKDASNNSYAGMSGSAAWGFESKDIRDLTVTTDNPLSESNLGSGATLTLSLTNDTFKNVDLSSSFTLNHAPTGTSVTGAVYVDDHTATLTLGYDGTDFDTDISDFSVTASGSALTSGRQLTSSVLPITAVVEVLPPVLVSTIPFNNATGVSKSANLSVTFDQDVTAVAGKNIIIHRPEDDGVVQTISVTDTSKVTISGGVVTIQHTPLSDSGNYYVEIQAGAFVNSDGLGNAAIADKTLWHFTTPASPPEMFFSEFLRGSGSHQVAIELYRPGGLTPNPAPSKAYSVFAYQYNTTTNSMEISEIKINAEAWTGVPLIIIDGAFYDFMDVTTVANFSAGYQYFNQDDVIYDWAPRVLKALVLKEGSQVLDVIGDPNATGPGSFLASGGTLVRKQGIVGGSTVYDSYQWDKYPVNTFTKIGNHTP